ncbi:MAG TPA: VC0807 family protein [Amycolatopsis sp.]|nr:VC0807 family protein [Amycolatopsis sp.]
MTKGRKALLIAFDIGAPIAGYYVLRAFGVSVYLALLITAALPAFGAVYQLARKRRRDGLALFMIVMTLLSAGLALLSGSERFLLARDGFLTAVSGAWMLATTRAHRPFVYPFARVLLERRVGPRDRSWDELWENLPAFRRVWRVANVIWGAATLLDAAVRFVMAYTLPVNVVPLLNGVQYAILFVVLQVVTNIYYFRVGLFDARSGLYRQRVPEPVMRE